MMKKFAERMWSATLSTSLEHLIDQFLNWIEELSRVIAPAQIGRLVNSEVRAKVLLD